MQNNKFQDKIQIIIEKFLFKKIRKNSYGNREFYHLIKDIDYSFGRSTESIDEEKVKKICKIY